MSYEREVEEKVYYVYVLTNKNGNVMYIGVTNNLSRRVNEHKNKLVKGFTKVYNIDKLVYYEEYSDIRDAIAREKQLKGWRRSRKNELVANVNPEWQELNIPG